MTYTKIKEDCPLAWKKMLEWRRWLEIKTDYKGVEENKLGYFATDGIHRVQNWIDLNKRDLYDFFDSYDLIILLDQDFSSQMLHFSIVDKNCTLLFESVDEWYDRKQTENFAFTEAFELLEQNLKLNESN